MYNEVINFFKYMELYNEEYFKIIEQNTKIIDRPYEEIKDFIGCFKIDNDNFKLILPKIKSVDDVLIYIHEYTHALFLDDNLEIFPNLMEAIYINNFIENKSLKRHLLNKTKKEIKNSTSKNHIIGKKVKIQSIKI